MRRHSLSPSPLPQVRAFVFPKFSPESIEPHCFNTNYLATGMPRFLKDKALATKSLSKVKNGAVMVPRSPVILVWRSPTIFLAWLWKERGFDFKLQRPGDANTLYEYTCCGTASIAVEGCPCKLLCFFSGNANDPIVGWYYYRHSHSAIGDPQNRGTASSNATNTQGGPGSHKMNVKPKIQEGLVEINANLPSLDDEAEQVAEVESCQFPISHIRGTPYIPKKV